MSDRKYRQRGYQDDGRERDRGPGRVEGTGGPRPPQDRPRGQPPEAPKTPNLMASHEVIRCRNCAQVVSPPIGTLATCPKCRAALHSCVQCTHFDPGARFQCAQPLPAPVTPKDGANDCRLFAPSVRVERQTGTPAGPPTAKQAFDDLFKL
jgi:hypothetical protein